MAMIEQDTVDRIVARCGSELGMNTSSPGWITQGFIEIVIQEVIAEIRKADVIVSSGSSAGSYKPI